MTRNDKVHAVVHAASASCAAIGAGLAQLPGSDAAAIVPLQIAMIFAIGELHGVSVTRSKAQTLLLTFPASIAGRQISQWLVGWIPGFGNAVNAATAATITEAIGWAADAYFAEP